MDPSFQRNQLVAEFLQRLQENTRGGNTENNGTDNNNNQQQATAAAAAAAQPPPPPELDQTQVHYLLEASGGNVDLALALYWEDSVAHHAMQHQEQAQQQGAPSADGGSGSGGREKKEKGRERREKTLQNLRQHQQRQQQKNNNDYNNIPAQEEEKEGGGEGKRKAEDYAVRKVKAGVYKLEKIKDDDDDDNNEGAAGGIDISEEVKEMLRLKNKYKKLSRSRHKRKSGDGTKSSSSRGNAARLKQDNDNNGEDNDNNDDDGGFPDGWPRAKKSRLISNSTKIKSTSATASAAASASLQKDDNMDNNDIESKKVASGGGNRSSRKKKEREDEQSRRNRHEMRKIKYNGRGAEKLASMKRLRSANADAAAASSSISGNSPSRKSSKSKQDDDNRKDNPDEEDEDDNDDIDVNDEDEAARVQQELAAFEEAANNAARNQNIDYLAAHFGMPFGRPVHPPEPPSNPSGNGAARAAPAGDGAEAAAAAAAAPAGGVNGDAEGAAAVAVAFAEGIKTASVSDDEAAERLLRRIKSRRTASRHWGQASTKRRRIWNQALSKNMTRSRESSSGSNDDESDEMKKILRQSMLDELKSASAKNKKNKLKQKEDENLVNTTKINAMETHYDHDHDFHYDVFQKYTSQTGLVSASRILWGYPHQPDDSSEENSNKSDDGNDSVISDIPPAGSSPVRHKRRKRARKDGEGASVAIGLGNSENEKAGGQRSADVNKTLSNDDDGSNGNPYDDDDDDDDDESSTDGGVIPRTWLSAGFSLSKCGTGLILSPPVDTELARLKTMQADYASEIRMQPKSTPLPPYHCGGISALLSIVTALLYSGASIDGNEVNCQSMKRRSFAELSVDERRREFPERLTDSLSCLLFIAAKEVNEKKKAVMQKAEAAWKLKKILRKQKSDQDMESTGVDFVEETDESVEDKRTMTMLRQFMRNRGKLVGVCRWEGNGDLKIPLDQLIDHDDELRMNVTLTNISDLRKFVSSNLRYYMRQGGCALFLETIVHIHGVSRVERMLRKGRNLASSEKLSPLVACECLERQRSEWHNKNREKVKKSREHMPSSHECLSRELVSLLLTGKIKCDLKDWNSDNLGIGMLSIPRTTGADQLCSHFRFPPKPIWILQGETCYSALWDESMRPVMGRQPCPENPLDSFHLKHWNCWYKVRNATDMHVVPDRKTHPSTENCNNTENTTEMSITEKGCDEKSLEVEIHEDDQRYYPKDFQRWRFRFNKKDTHKDSKEGGHGDDETECLKPPAWIPYFRLDEWQKDAVNRKLAPRINLAIWTNWPKATVYDIPSVPPIV